MKEFISNYKNRELERIHWLLSDTSDFQQTNVKYIDL